MRLGEQLKHAVQYWKREGLGFVARVAATKVVNLFYPVLPPITYKSLMMWLRLGYWPNIRNPRTFNEKIAHRQLIAPHPLASLLADKLRVREYVAERGLAHILNEVYYVTDKPETIPFDDLPDNFVIKANHGSGWNIFVRDKNTLDRQAVIRQCQKWLNQKYYKVARSYELHYASIKPLVIIEKFLEDSKHGCLRDYKVNCFHGKAHYIDVISEGPRGRTLIVYDRDWNPSEYTYSLPKGAQVPKPSKLESLIEAAETLSKDIDYCRVDLYLLNDEELVFGEITMNPLGGSRRFTSREQDLKYGEHW